MSESSGSGAVPQLDAVALVERVPELRHYAEVVPRSFRQVPGAHLGLADVRALAKEIERSVAEGIERIVVTQGTDTIEETAFALDLLVCGGAAIVLTGAMRHASQPGFDGPANLLDAVCVASSGASRGAGVVVVINSEIHAARFVRKAHSFQMSAFVSRVGPLGWVSEGCVRLMLRPSPVIVPAAQAPAVRACRVAIIPSALGDDDALIRAVPTLGYDALVIDALGGGHVSAHLAESLEEVGAAIPVVFCSRTSGPVLSETYGFEGSERDLLRRGLIGGGYLDAYKARILLMLLLDGGADRSSIQDAFRAFNGAGGRS
jgi:L-asparaginase